MRRLELVGRKVGKLTVIRFTESRKLATFWLCRCECGGEIVTRGSRLTRGSPVSCGCSRPPARLDHGGSGTPEYHSWCGMKKRCNDKNDKRYHLYGGRGISVCARWANSFANFLSDMGAKPGAGYSIDRIDNDKGYSPDNCRWATQKQQQRNRGNNVMILVGKREVCVAEAAEIAGIPLSTFRHRLRSGWSAKKAMKTPLRSY